MQYDESLVDLAAALKGHPVDVVLIMCTDPESATAGLPILRDVFDGPVGVYPNIGYNPTGPLANRPQLTNRRPSSGPDILQTGQYPPSRLADFAGEWKEMGAQIIGGCWRRALSTSGHAARSQGTIHSRHARNSHPPNRRTGPPNPSSPTPDREPTLHRRAGAVPRGRARQTPQPSSPTRRIGEGSHPVPRSLSY